MKNSLALIIATNSTIEVSIKNLTQKILKEELTPEEISEEIKKLMTMFMLQGEHVKFEEMKEVVVTWIGRKIERDLKSVGEKNEKTN